MAGSPSPPPLPGAATAVAFPHPDDVSLHWHYSPLHLAQTLAAQLEAARAESEQFTEELTELRRKLSENEQAAESARAEMTSMDESHSATLANMEASTAESLAVSLEPGIPRYSC